LEIPDRRIVYCFEYLGYLPFGLYHWVMVDGSDISPRELPDEFSIADFNALEREGLLRRVDEWINPDDELESKITFEVTAT
jgi:hypothetical protein